MDEKEIEKRLEELQEQLNEYRKQVEALQEPLGRLIRCKEYIEQERQKNLRSYQSRLANSATPWAQQHDTRS
jgi:regulator of replication initiation timing